MPSSPSSPRRVFLGVSGASGALYAVRTLQMLVAAGVAVDLVYSSAARRVLQEETAMMLQDDPTMLLEEGQDASLVKLWPHGDIGAPPASGTAMGEAVLLVPCSLSTVAGIAHGSAANLLERAAQVALKEGRKLIVVPREAPLGRTHLDNLSRLAWAGATVLPASPGFYHHPKTILDLVDHVCAKILACCDIEQTSVPAWDGGLSQG